MDAQERSGFEVSGFEDCGPVLAVSALVSVAALAPASAGAATITVNTTNDEDGSGANCSLREAVGAAITNGDGDGCDTDDEVAGAYNTMAPGADEIVLSTPSRLRPGRGHRRRRRRADRDPQRNPAVRRTISMADLPLQNRVFALISGDADLTLGI